MGKPVKAWAVFKRDCIDLATVRKTRGDAISAALWPSEMWAELSKMGYTVRKVTITEGWPPALNMPHARLDAAAIAGNDAGEMED